MTEKKTKRPTTKQLDAMLQAVHGVVMDGAFEQRRGYDGERAEGFMRALRGLNADLRNAAPGFRSHESERDRKKREGLNKAHLAGYRIGTWVRKQMEAAS